MDAIAGQKWLRLTVEHVVDRRLVLTLDEQDIPETFCREQNRRGTPALDERVCRNGRAMKQFCDAVCVMAAKGEELLQPVDGSDAGISRSRGKLMDREPSVAIRHHQVGERAADINTDNHKGNS